MSGANAKQITATNAKGEVVRTWVIASGEVVELGGWSFKREELILAMGVTKADLQAVGQEIPRQ